jgi:hypothetical protein
MDYLHGKGVVVLPLKQTSENSRQMLPNAGEIYLFHDSIRQGVVMMLLAEMLIRDSCAVVQHLLTSIIFSQT